MRDSYAGHEPQRAAACREGQDVTSSDVPVEFGDLFTEAVVATVASVDGAGAPTVSPIWIEYRDGNVIFSTLERTLKRRNLAGNAAVAFCLLDPANPYRYVELRGVVIEMTSVGAHEHLDLMARRYWGEESYPGHDYAAARSLVTAKIDRVNVEPPLDPAG